MRPGTGDWISFDGYSWSMVSADGACRSLPCGEDAVLPEPAGLVAGLFWPLERMLTRPFRLPLSHPRLIDAEIIGQDLAEQAGEDPAAWWPSWRAAPTGDGVAGIWFALPDAVRGAIDADPAWQAMPDLIVDATARLGAWLPGDDAPLAVLDMDADGLFLGFRRDGAWLGMRRLNGAAAAWDTMAAEAGRSLAAMGWLAGEHGATGRLPPSLVTALGIRDWQGEACEASDLPGRHQANLALSGAMPGTAVNLRHGRWAVRRHPMHGAWRRSLSLAAMLLLTWTLGTSFQLYRLSHQEDGYRRQIATAFHRGLPHETVMLDALAQLRKAAGGGAAGDGGEWLRQLQAVAQVYRQHPWQLRELDFEQGSAHMSGTVQGLAVLNAIRQDLASRLGRDVELADTDLQGKSVAFRINW